MPANDRQVDGDHYKTDIEPWDYIIANRLGFMEGNIIKYVARARAKNGKTDYTKALHYVQKLMENVRGWKPPSAGSLAISVKDFAKANSLTSAEENVVLLMTIYQKASDLAVVEDMLKRIIEHGADCEVDCVVDSETGDRKIVEPNVPESVQGTADQPAIIIDDPVFKAMLEEQEKPKKKPTREQRVARIEKWRTARKRRKNTRGKKKQKDS